MPEAANLLVGSTCGSVYIVRCDPNARSVSLKTTITAGTTPLDLIVDVENKCFYCLDQERQESPEGHLLTLAPTEFGTIEESMSIGIGGARPHHMMSLGQNIFICHAGGYSVVKSPLVPKSKRRRRLSSLAPVTEDAVAENLDELYRISKTMSPDDGETAKGTAGSANAIANIQQHLSAETHIDATDLTSVVAMRDPFIKFVHWRRLDYIIGIKSDGVTSFRVAEDGALTPLSTLHVRDVVDCEAADDSLYVLCRGAVRQGSLVDGALTVGRSYDIVSTDVLSLRVLKDRTTAFVLTTSGVISIDLASGKQQELETRGTSMNLSNDDRLLFVADHPGGTLTMFSVQGQELGRCKVREPVNMVHMS